MDGTERAIAQIDEMMDHASVALVETRYFDAVSLCTRAMLRALQAHDFERLSRICLPLQEGRRQIRQLATDTRVIRVVSSPEEIPSRLEPGCYLLQPPMIGADARSLRLAGERTKTPAFVLTREPLTLKGRWPVVGVGRVVVRTQVDPPVELERDPIRVSRDRYMGDPPPTLEWFEDAAEALGDAAIASVAADLHPWWRVEELVEKLEACPDHEKLHQALEAAALEASQSEPPDDIRRPDPFDNKWSF
ncbi:MAG: hypothetical protein CMJ31_03490 [Phycisphaerae bacterium]|nr:hypothetical protein [Phycisphaerae bacterium]